MVTQSGPTFFFSMEDFLLPFLSPLLWVYLGYWPLLVLTLVVWMDQKINPFLLDFPT